MPEIWEAHFQGMFESLRPEGYHENELARRIAELLWRLRRASMYETELINSAIHGIPDAWTYEAVRAEYAKKFVGIEPEPPSVERLHRAIGVRMLPKDVVTITRYEAHLHRTYIQTLHELEALQARRRGEPVSLARLDISGPPAS